MKLLTRRILTFMTVLWLTGCTVSVGTWSAAFGQLGDSTRTIKSDEPHQLNESIVKLLIRKQLGSDEIKVGEYEIEFIEFVTGFFLNEMSISALALSYDDCCGRNFAAKLWLLIYDNEWKLKRQITVGGNLEFKVMTIANNVRPLVWCIATASGTGVDASHGSLLLIGPETDDVLFEYNEIDECATGFKNSRWNSHNVEFRDLDGDGTLEIMDTETRGKCNNAKGKQTIKSVYKFDGNKYIKSK